MNAPETIELSRTATCWVAVFDAGPLAGLGPLPLPYTTDATADYVTRCVSENYPHARILTTGPRA
jgi:hypothetical protein